MAEGNGNAAKWIAIGCLAAIVFLCCCCGGLGGMIWQLGLKEPMARRAASSPTSGRISTRTC